MESWVQCSLSRLKSHALPTEGPGTLGPLSRLQIVCYLKWSPPGRDGLTSLSLTLQCRVYYYPRRLLYHRHRRSYHRIYREVVAYSTICPSTANHVNSLAQLRLYDATLPSHPCPPSALSHTTALLGRTRIDGTACYILSPLQATS
jgi:hypothetical protein